MNITHIQRAKGLVAQAIAAASQTDNSHVLEAKKHLQQALLKLERVEEKHSKKEADTQFTQWWGHIQSGVAAAPMSVPVQNRTLAQLNAMIAQEQKKLDDLEKIPEVELPDDLLRD